MTPDTKNHIAQIEAEIKKRDIITQQAARITGQFITIGGIVINRETIISKAQIEITELIGEWNKILNTEEKNHGK